VNSFWYLAALLVASGCMLLIDRRFRLFFWHNAAAATLVTLAGTAFLLLWDAVGIATGIFLHGSASISSGVLLAPELPIEEPVFLVFLVLCTMVLYTGAARILRARARARASKSSTDVTFGAQS
jgi:lycopene cyclase domain-containing protein